MNLFRDYISDPLYEVAIKILTSSHLFEMAYERKSALSDIRAHAAQLARKMVMVHHTQDSRDLPHWKTTLNAHIREIHKLTFLKGKKRMSESDIHENVFDGPFGEYNDYVLHHDDVVSDKSDTNFSPHSEKDYTEIKNKYSRLVDMLHKNPLSPKYTDLFDA